MMAISTKGRYSLRILLAMASSPQGCMLTKHEIARAEGISPAYVQQLMMTLKATGFVNSHRGKVGGFTLARTPETMTVAEVLKATEGPTVPAPCLGVDRCERELNCSMRPLWIRAAELLENLFSGVTIAELAQNRASERPLVDSRADVASRMPVHATIRPAPSLWRGFVSASVMGDVADSSSKSKDRSRAV